MDVISLENLGTQTGITDNLSVILGASASASNDAYNGMKIDITVGTLVMTRTISDYVGATKKAVLTAALDVDPSETDEYRVYTVDSVASKIDLEAVKVYMAVESGETKYNDLIEDAIAAAYGKLDHYISYDPDTGVFSEYNDGLVQDQVFVSGIAADIVLNKIEIDDEEIDLTEDISRRDSNHWKVTNDDYLDDPEMFYAEYTSEKLTAKINRILMEVIIFELNKLPAFNNSISRKTHAIEGVVTENFVTDDAFYREIDKKFSELFLRKI